MLIQINVSELMHLISATCTNAALMGQYTTAKHTEHYARQRACLIELTGDIGTGDPSECVPLAERLLQIAENWRCDPNAVSTR